MMRGQFCVSWVRAFGTLGHWVRVVTAGYIAALKVRIAAPGPETC